jgi:hypothetical protein
MRVIESPMDGELVQAATDDELVRALMRHYERDHPNTPLGEDEARRLVSEHAYDATDS